MKKLLILILFSSMSIVAQNYQDVVPTISVSGTGIVKIVPDKAIIKLQVEQQGKAAKETKASVDEVVDGVIKYCRKQNIAANDVQTKRISLQKNYNYQKKTYEFRASQAVHIVVRDLKDYDTIMEGLLNTGINRIDGVQLLSSKQEELVRKARIAAMQNAKQKAKEYANAVGQKIGKAITISEFSNPKPVYRAKSMAPMADMTLESSTETLAVGELEIKTKVSVIFELY